MAELYQRHAGSVLAFAHRRLHDAGQAKDVAEAVFVDLWRQPGAFGPARGSLRSDLVTHAYWECLRLQGVPRRRHLHLMTAAHPCSTGNESVAIDLACLGGLTSAEIAAVMALPEEAALVHIRRGLRRLGEEGTSRQ